MHIKRMISLFLMILFMEGVSCACAQTVMIDTCDGECQGHEISGSDPVLVRAGEHSIVLSDAGIDVASQEDACAFCIASGSSVTLELEGNSFLYSGAGRAGLEVEEGASVTIRNGHGFLIGSLAACAGAGGAGIGGAANRGSGEIIIQGGKVMASGCAASDGQGASIGGGCGGDAGGIEINGGVVVADLNALWNGEWKSAGIGGGERGGCSEIRISGGEVYVLNAGVGIGSCKGDMPGEIRITGGSIYLDCNDVAMGMTLGVQENPATAVGRIDISGGKIYMNNGARGIRCNELAVSGGDIVSCEVDEVILANHLMIEGGSVNGQKIASVQPET